MEPVFSVIIPAYNRAQLLPRAIRSVLQQTYGNFELIVVDDGSTDDTRSVMQDFDDPRIRYIYQENRGVSAARNQGADLAHGEHLTFLDSDDAVLPEWLERFAELLEGQNSWVACCGIFKVDDHGNKTATLPHDLGLMLEHQRGLFLAGSFALQRGVFRAVGGYVEGLQHSENTELALRLVPHCIQRGKSIASIQEPLCCYHKRPFVQSGQEQEFQVILEATMYIMGRHGERLAKSPKTYAAYCGIAGVNAARLENFNLARACFRNGFRVYPWRLRTCVQFLLTLIPLLGRRVWHREWA